jgi:hypothetical protein
MQVGDVGGLGSLGSHSHAFSASLA